MSGNHEHSNTHLGHVIPDVLLLKVLVALLILTGITVFVATIDFGILNIVIAMLVASIKATLVILFFMHGAYENKIVWTYIILPFVLLAIMIGGVYLDNPFREVNEPFNKEPVKQEQAAEPAHH